MPIEARGKGYLSTVHHKGERFRRQFPTKAEAEAWELQAKAALLRGELPDMGDSPVSGAPATLSGLRDLTYKLRWQGKSAEKTAMQNANICIRALGDISPAKVSTAAIDAMVFKWMDEGTADATINRRLSALSTMLKVGRDRGFLTVLPKIDRRDEDNGRIRFLTEEEEKEVLAWFDFIDNEDMKDLVTVAIDTGMRRSELLKITAMDVHGDLIHLWETKNKSARSVPMTSRVKAIIEKRTARHKSGSLWPDLTKDMVRQGWDSARRHMGLMNDPWFVFHALRHTFVSRLVQRGVNLKMVAELAGHRVIQTTMRYAHLAPKNLVDAIKVLEQEAA